MRYQLTLQFHGDSLDDYDAIIALENELNEELGDSAEVDGHDVGSGQANVFILTSDPLTAFQRAKPVLERKQYLQAARAAYRPVQGEHYTVIWPENSTTEFRVI